MKTKLLRNRSQDLYVQLKPTRDGLPTGKRIIGAPPPKQPVDAGGPRGHGRNDESLAALTRARALRDGSARSSRPPREPLRTPPAYR